MRRRLPAALLALSLLAGCKPQPAAPPADAAAPPADMPTAAPAVIDAPSAPASAKDEIKAAMDSFLGVRSFHATMRMTGTAMPGGMTTEMDFVAPDRYRMQMPMGTQVIIGDTMYMSVQGRAAKVPMAKGTLSQWRDPAKLAQNQATLTVEPQGREAIDGAAARKYLVRNTQPQPTDVTMWIGDDGLPLQIRHTSSAEGKTVDMTIRYTRYNDPSIKVDPPQ